MMTYSEIHGLVAKTRGKASEHKCLHCDLQAQQWSFHWETAAVIFYTDESSRRPGMVYSNDVADYDPLCTGCHNRRDGRGFSGLTQERMTEIASAGGKIGGHIGGNMTGSQNLTNAWETQRDHMVENARKNGKKLNDVPEEVRQARSSKAGKASADAGGGLVAVRKRDPLFQARAHHARWCEREHKVRLQCPICYGVQTNNLEV